MPTTRNYFRIFACAKRIIFNRQQLQFGRSGVGGPVVALPPLVFFSFSLPFVLFFSSVISPLLILFYNFAFHATNETKTTKRIRSTQKKRKENNSEQPPRLDRHRHFVLMVFRRPRAPFFPFFFLYTRARYNISRLFLSLINNLMSRLT